MPEHASRAPNFVNKSADSEIQRPGIDKVLTFVGSCGAVAASHLCHHLGRAQLARPGCAFHQLQWRAMGIGYLRPASRRADWQLALASQRSDCTPLARTNSNISSSRHYHAATYFEAGPTTNASRSNAEPKGIHYSLWRPSRTKAVMSHRDRVEQMTLLGLVPCSTPRPHERVYNVATPQATTAAIQATSEIDILFEEEPELSHEHDIEAVIVTENQFEAAPEAGKTDTSGSQFVGESIGRASASQPAPKLSLKSTESDQNSDFVLLAENLAIEPTETSPLTVSPRDGILREMKGSTPEAIVQTSSPTGSTQEVQNEFVQSKTHSLRDRRSQSSIQTQRAEMLTRLQKEELTALSISEPVTTQNQKPIVGSMVAVSPKPTPQTSSPGNETDSDTSSRPASHSPQYGGKASVARRVLRDREPSSRGLRIFYHECNMTSLVRRVQSKTRIKMKRSHSLRSDLESAVAKQRTQSKAVTLPAF